MFGTCFVIAWPFICYCFELVLVMPGSCLVLVWLLFGSCDCDCVILGWMLCVSFVVIVLLLLLF